MERDEKLRLLSGVPLFSKCSRTSLARIARLADEVDLPAGRVLMSQGETGQEFFVIVEGTVLVDRDGHTINTLGRGDFLGEISLIDHRPRSATATCETPCRVLVLAHREFHTLLAEAPGIQSQVLAALGERLRSLEPQTAD